MKTISDRVEKKFLSTEVPPLRKELILYKAYNGKVTNLSLIHI